MQSNLPLLLALLARNRWIILLLPLLLLAATTAQAQMTYYWRGAPGAAFTAATSWNILSSGTGANRTNSQASDVLIFDGGSPVVTMNIGQTIARLKFINNTSVTLNSSSNSTNTITINGDATDDDLIVANGSTVTLMAIGTSLSTAGVVLSLGTSATGKVAGTITLTNTMPNANAPTSANKLVSATDNSLRFIAGGQLNIFGSINSTAFSGTPIFEAGSTLEQNAANSSDISAVNSAEYRSGSTFRFIDGTFGSADLSADRTFGNLDFASAFDRTIGGRLNLTILNNLIMTGSGSLVLSARGNANTVAVGTLIGGNINNANPAATLSFSSSTAMPNMPKVSFNGTTPQTISNAGTLTFGPNTKLEINNPAGVTLQTDLTIANDLLLTNGLLTTGASGAGLLTLSSPTTAANGNATSFVNGPMARVNATTNATLLFPVGKVAANGDLNYRPITLALTNQAGSVTYTAQQFEASGAAFGVLAPVDHVSTRRYYTVSASSPPTGTGFSAAITLSFGPDDYVTNATTAALVIAKRNGGTWSSIGSTNTGTGTNSGTPLTGALTSGPFTSFSDFTLASTTANVVGYPGVNPLPVELIRFETAAKGASVILTWATASEKNSAYFDVQRSATGSAYETLGRVTAQGSSSSLHTYKFMDARPLTSLAYYRLRQVDIDGTTAHSPVATVRAHVETGTDTRAAPNPTTGLVLLPAGLGPTQYRLLDIMGRTVLQGPVASSGQLDLSPLPRGTFWLELTDAAGRHVQRLVRE